MEYGFDGVIVGYATNMDLVKHYCEVFGAEHIAMLHPNQIAIYENEAANIRKVFPLPVFQIQKNSFLLKHEPCVSVTVLYCKDKFNVLKDTA